MQVSASAKLSEVDEREGHEFEAKMMRLLGLKAQPQSCSFILPRKSTFDGEAQFGQYFVKEALAEGLAPTLRLLPVARILFDVWLHPGIEDTLAIVDVASGARAHHPATNPCYRWQNHGEFGMLFNTVMNFNDLKTMEKKAGATAGGQ